MHINESRKKIISSCLFVIEVILLFIMCSFFFPAVDEMDFLNYLSFSNFSELIHNVIYFGNGRFLGNLIGVFFSFHYKIFFLLEPLLIALLCVLTEKLVDVKYAKHLVLGFIMLKPVFVFAEMISRISVFTNYYLPLLFMIGTLLIIKKAFLENKNPKLFSCIILFVLGFLEQLFVESNTVVNLALSLFIIIYFAFKKKRKSAPVVLFISNLLGALPIMLYSFYINAADTFTYQVNLGYRNTIFSGDLFNAVYIWASNAQFPIYYFSLFISFYFACICLMVYASKKYGISKRNKNLMIFSCLLYIASYIYNVYIKINYSQGIPADKEMPILLLVVILFLAASVPLIILIVQMVIKNCKHKTEILAVFFMGFVSFAPFLVAFPSGYRCYEQMFFFFMLALLLILRDVSSGDQNVLFRASAFVGILSCTCLVFYAYFYSKDNKVYQYREKYCYTSYYLPEYSWVLSRGENIADRWEERSKMSHEYIPMSEFEEWIENFDSK